MKPIIPTGKQAALVYSGHAQIEERVKVVLVRYIWTNRIKSIIHTIYDDNIEGNNSKNPSFTKFKHIIGSAITNLEKELNVLLVACRCDSL